jgi:hypothetical protein
MRDGTMGHCERLEEKVRGWRSLVTLVTNLALKNKNTWHLIEDSSDNDRYSIPVYSTE